MKIDQKILDTLTEQAKASPRLRMNLDLRNSPEDNSQRMLNAMEPGSQVAIHRHCKTSETMVVLRGRLVVDLYNASGEACEESVELTPNGAAVAINVPLGQWHTARSLESGTVFIGVMDGHYEPLGPEDILGGGMSANIYE